MNSKLLPALLCLLSPAAALAQIGAGVTPDAADKPEVTAAAALPGTDKPEVACLVQAPDGKDIGCAANYRNLAEGYLAAYKSMDAWIAMASKQVSGAEEKVAKLETAVRENETAMTALKLERSKDAKAKLKDLSIQNKQLWKELGAARAEQAAICKGFKREAAAKVKELAGDLQQRLGEAQKAE